MSFLLRAFSLISIPLSLWMFYQLIRSIGREQPYRRELTVRSMLIPGGMLLVNILFMVSAFLSWSLGIWLVMLLGGLAFGYAWGGRSKLYARGETLVVRRTVLHLVFWAGAYAFTQLLATVFPADITAAGLATMFFSTGSSLGMNANLLRRQSRLA